MAFRVLIVDDSPAMRSVIRRVLDLSGFEMSECLEASQGEEAWGVLRDHRVDIILTDINMPVMNGEQFLVRLRQDELLKSTPVVVVSTDATEQRIRRMLALGARGYVTKPFFPEALRQELERLVGTGK